MTRRTKRGGRLPKSLLLFLLGVLAGALGLYYLKWRSAPAVAQVTPAPAGTSGTATPTAPPATPAAVRSPLPRRTPRHPSVPADFESAGGGSGVLALVLDDLGFEDGSLARLEAFSGPLGLAVLPDAPRAREAAALAKRKGWDLLVHLPITPESGPGEAGAVGPGDDDRTITSRVERALDRLPGAIGLNNHQGSRGTTDARVMRTLLRVVRDRGLFFLDSRTTPSSIADREARALGISTVSRDVFLDDAATEAGDPGGTAAALAAAWARAREIATRKGTCVVIGHPHRSTLDFLAASLPGLERDGIRRVRVSELAD